MSRASQEIWKDRYEKWLHYLHNVAGAIAAGREIPLGPSDPPPTPPAADAYADTPAKVVYCAPHPDDEAISGVLALRLRLDSGARVTNIAMTLGSDKRQRPRRLRELESACQALGFDLIVPHHPHGFEQVTEVNRNQHPEEWGAKVDALRRFSTVKCRIWSWLPTPRTSIQPMWELIYSLRRRWGRILSRAAAVRFCSFKPNSGIKSSGPT